MEGWPESLGLDDTHTLHTGSRKVVLSSPLLMPTPRPPSIWLQLPLPHPVLRRFPLPGLPSPQAGKVSQTLICHITQEGPGFDPSEA